MSASWTESNVAQLFALQIVSTDTRWSEQFIYEAPEGRPFMVQFSPRKSVLEATLYENYTYAAEAAERCSFKVKVIHVKEQRTVALVK